MERLKYRPYAKMVERTLYRIMTQTGNPVMVGLSGGTNSLVFVINQNDDDKNENSGPLLSLARAGT